MTLKIIILVFCYSFIIASCDYKRTNHKEIDNDTTKVIEFALKISFENENLPGLTPLKTNYNHKDSFLFTTDFLTINLLPQKSGTQIFKILSLNEVCSLILSDSNQIQYPNYLYLRRFEVNDSGYYVSLQSLSCVPFGGGGGIGIYTNKELDSLYAKRIHRSSIN